MPAAPTGLRLAVLACSLATGVSGGGEASGGVSELSASGSSFPYTQADVTIEKLGTSCCSLIDKLQPSSTCEPSAIRCLEAEDTGSGRRLSGGSSVGFNEASPAESVALVFAVMALVIGVVSEKLLAKLHESGGPAIPYTAFILVIGLITRMFAELPGTYQHFSCSFHVWEKMDGHLLLYLFIPPLVFGDAMNLDFNILKNCLSQCALLAFPGVALGALLFALVVKSGMIPGAAHWSWPLSMAFGSVMSATDPVAVVSLLKELGAPDSLTMIIGGESLLNDGMAMIVWAVRRCSRPSFHHPLQESAVTFCRVSPRQVFFNTEMNRAFMPHISVYILVLFFGSILIGLAFGLVSPPSPVHPMQPVPALVRPPGWTSLLGLS